MALRLTKNSKIIFAVSIVVLSAALGFLIWRVNQDKTVAPTDTEAGDDQCNCCPQGYTSENPAIVPDWYAGCIACQCTFTANMCRSDADGSYIPQCGVAECNDGSDCDLDCLWPSVNFCDITEGGVCECQDVNNGCDDPEPTCTPSCPAGYSECSGADCGADKVTEECSARCAGCDNLYYVRITCDRDELINVCDGGAWVSRPTGNYNFDANISFSATATDSNGINNSSITAKLCTGSITECTAGEAIPYTISSTNPTSTTFGGTLSSAADRLIPGTYTLSLAWADTLGATGANCKLTTVFTVQPEETNPNWDITKAVVELCIDESTPDPKSELSYTITVKNTGNAAGTISKIEDVLDSKILEAGVVPSNITTPGIYANGKITWTFTTPLPVAAGATAVFTYKATITKDNFGTYNNTVTLTPVNSSTIQATASITADCVITPDEEIPETGIFDTTLGRIIGGFTLLIFGAIVYNIPNRVFLIKRKGESYKYRVRFEKKIANR